MTISFSSSNLRDDATSGNGDYRLDKLPETTPSTSVFDRADVTYRQFTELHGQARDTRREAHVVELESKTGERARCAPMHALEQLADYGFAWRDIARVVGVSVPAITKWRKGAGVTGENRLKNRPSTRPHRHALGPIHRRARLLAGNADPSRSGNHPNGPPGARSI